MSVKNANGVNGVLLSTFGSYVFRVYNRDYTFKDYQLTHPDLSVTITDADAYFIETESGMYLDMKPYLEEPNDN